MTWIPKVAVVVATLAQCNILIEFDFDCKIQLFSQSLLQNFLIL